MLELLKKGSGGAADGNHGLLSRSMAPSQELLKSMSPSQEDKDLILGVSSTTRQTVNEAGK